MGIYICVYISISIYLSSISLSHQCSMLEDEIRNKLKSCNRKLLFKYFYCQTVKFFAISSFFPE